jgi:glyoxylase-like metal-dependent hydrolase (beta-lactamase superfamily II)
MQRALILGALVIVGALSSATAARQQATGQQTPNVVQTDKLRDNLYVMKGGGGNSAVFITANGVVVVDTKNPGWGQPLLDAIRKVTDKPVTTIINTHTHYDHSGSNTEFPATVEFVAHEGTRANMARTTCDPVTNCDAFKGANAKYLPKRTYKDRLTLGSGADQVDLYHFGRGHTSGDTFVVFPAVRAMHTGDMYPRPHMPFIDVANSGGAAVEFADTLQKAVSTIKNVETVIGGHTPSPVTWSDFVTYTDFYRDFLNSAREAMKKGVSAEAFAKGYQVPARYKGFQADPARVLANAEAIWAETKGAGATR